MGLRGLFWIGTLLLCSALARGQEIALTFDDMPAHGALPPGETRQQVGDQIIAALKQAGIAQVMGFVNGIGVEQQPDTIHVLEAWRAAGNPLGNHAWSHMNLNEHTLAEFEANVQKNEPMLEKLMGSADWRWLRFPNTAEGDTPEKRAGIRAFLLQHHYRVAAVTMSFDDYAWNEPYERCAVKKDDAAIEGLAQSYLKAARQSVDGSRGMAKTLYGHDIPYVLLMHLGPFDAYMLPRLLALYRSLGVHFVTLEQAEKDPFYRPDVDLSATGPGNLWDATYERHLPLPPNGIPADLQTVCR